MGQDACGFRKQGKEGRTAGRLLNLLARIKPLHMESPEPRSVALILLLWISDSPSWSIRHPVGKWGKDDLNLSALIFISYIYKGRDTFTVAKRGPERHGWLLGQWSAPAGQHGQGPALKVTVGWGRPWKLAQGRNRVRGARHSLREQNLRECPKLVIEINNILMQYYLKNQNWCPKIPCRKKWSVL